MFSLCCCSGDGSSSLLLSLGNVTAGPAAVAGAAGRGGAGRPGGGFPGAAARCQRSAPGGGGGVRRRQQELRAPGGEPGGAGGGAGAGESDRGEQFMVKTALLLFCTLNKMANLDGNQEM